MSKRSNDGSNYEWEGGDGAEGQKRPRGQDGERVRLLVLGRYAGPLIGRGGENLKRLREQYNVKITGLNSRANERVLQILGPRADSLAIVKELLPQCPEARFSASGHGKCTFEVNVLAHTDSVGALIGKGGSRMKEITEEAGIKLKVYPECLPNSNERVVAIGGDNEDTICKGVLTILNVLDNSPPRTPSHFFNPEHAEPTKNNNMNHNNMNNNNMNIPVGNNRNMGSNNLNNNLNNLPNNNMNFNNLNNMMAQLPSLQPSAPAAADQNVAAILMEQKQRREASGMDLTKDFGSVETTTTVTLPNELCGVIIGKGGTNIRYIKQVSGARVETSKGEPGSTEKRTISLSGTQDQVQIAEQLMAQCIRSNNNNNPQQQQQQQQQNQDQEMSHQQFVNQLSQTRSSRGTPLPLHMPWNQSQNNFMVS
jgi:heterogeneous nuclear ribonucleoprotein K